MLSYVEFYRPKFFLLENVLGLLNHRLRVNKEGPQEGNIVAHGVVKYILRTLTSLGYVHVHISYPEKRPLKTGELCDHCKQISSALQRPASWGLRIAAESPPCYLLGCTTRPSSSRVPDSDT